MKKENISLEHNNRSLLLDVAFLDYSRFSNVSEADISLLYERVEQIKKDFEENKEYALDAMVQYDLENIQSKEDLKRRIQAKRAEIAGKILTYTGIEKSDDAPHFISSYLKKLGLKKEADLLTEALLKEKLHESFDDKLSKADKLSNLLMAQNKQLKQNLAEHFEIYQKSGTSHPIIQTLQENIEGYLCAQQQALSFNFDVRPEDKLLRDFLREDFNRYEDPISKTKDGVKAAFLKSYGYMMEAGKNILDGNDASMSYNLFKKNLQTWFGPSYETEMFKALNANSAAECEAKFYEKSKNLYVKTVAALLSKKMEYDAEHKIYSMDTKTYVSNVIISMA